MGADGYPVAEVHKTAIHPNYEQFAEHWSRVPGKTYIDRSNQARDMSN